jgi:hypothetical protein
VPRPAWQRRWAASSQPPLHSDVAGDLQNHLILDEAGLSGRGNVDDPPVEARRQLLLTPLRRRSGLLRGQSAAPLDTRIVRRHGNGEEVWLALAAIRLFEAKGLVASR